MKHRKWMIGGILIAAALFSLTLLNLQDTFVYFYTPKEIIMKMDEIKGKTIRVGALVKEGSVDWDPEKLELKFIATDSQGVEFDVFHRGVRPDMFKENQGVVIEGTFNLTGMNSTRLFVKHSEEYRKPDDHNSMDLEYLKKSMFKNESY